MVVIDSMGAANNSGDKLCHSEFDVEFGGVNDRSKLNVAKINKKLVPSQYDTKL
jgi:hypothetical protein